MPKPLEPVAQRAVPDCAKAVVGLGLGRAGLCALHHPVRRALGRSALLRNFGQRPQPAAAFGSGGGPAAYPAFLWGACGLAVAPSALARGSAAAPAGLGGIGRHRRAQPVGVPAVVRAVSGGGAAGAVAAACFPGRWGRARGGLCGVYSRGRALGLARSASGHGYRSGQCRCAMELLAGEPALPGAGAARAAVSAAKLGPVARNLVI